MSPDSDAATAALDAPEVVHLGSGEPLVPEPLLMPPFRQDSRGIIRELAALLLDRHLRRLARMRNPVDLRLGRLLNRLDRTSGVVALGFARLSDYAVERLGLPARRARALVTLACGLESLPCLAAAFEAGEVSRSQVRLLLRIATPDTEAAWIGRARLLNVRRLEREVRAALDEGDESPGAAVGAVLADHTEDESRGEWLDLSVPHRLQPMWDRALELARRTSAASDPTWACAEIIAADFLSGVPDLAARLAREVGPDESPDAPPDAATDAPGAVSAPGDPLSAVLPCANQDDTDLFEEVLRALEDETGSRRWAPALDGLRVHLPQSAEPLPDDAPRAIDRRLRELARLRQEIAWHQGRLLRLFVGRRLHRDLGFLSFARYCSERAGLGVRRAWDLVGLDRRLWMLPRVADAYRSGTLSWVRAAAIARVATEQTEVAWITLAESVTVRRLEEEIAVARRIAGSRSYPPMTPPGLDRSGRVQLSVPDGEAPIDPAPVPAPPAAGVQTSAKVGGWTRIRFWAPHDVATLWHQAIRVARGVMLDEAGGNGSIGTLGATGPSDWQCLERLLASFLDAWGVRTDPAWRRKHRVFERDGWRCRVPGCSSRDNLQVHHVVFRSRGGGDEDTNLAVLCATHHLRGIHQGWLRCHSLPGGLLAWEFAPDLRDGPLARFVEDVTWSAARAAVAC